MKLVKVRYTGRKPYQDKTVMKNRWSQGDVIAVPEDDALTLLRFAEFEPAGRAKEVEAHVETAGVLVDDKQAREDAEAEQERNDDLQAEQAAAAAKVRDARKRQADLREREAALTTVETMDKEGLAAYAAKYEHPLDKRSSVTALRAEVQGLIERFGAR